MRLLYVRHCFLSFPACMTKRVCCGCWHMGIWWVIGWTDQLNSSSAELAYHLLQYTHINKAHDTYSIHIMKFCVIKHTTAHHGCLHHHDRNKVSRGEKKTVIQCLVTDVNKHQPQHQIKDIKMAPLSVFFQLYGCFSACGYERHGQHFYFRPCHIWFQPIAASWFAFQLTSCAPVAT